MSFIIFGIGYSLVGIGDFISVGFQNQIAGHHFFYQYLIPCPQYLNFKFRLYLEHSCCRQIENIGYAGLIGDLFKICVNLIH